MRFASSVVCLILFAALIMSSCKNQPNRSSQTLSNADLLRGDIILCSGNQFGEVSFASSCDYSVRENFNLAVSLLHSFEYAEAEKVFAKVIDADPDCAMAYWGVAMSIYHSLWAPPGVELLKKGARLLDIAASVPKTEREQEYLEAIGLYYTNWGEYDAQTRARKMADKMEAIYRKYPDDTEAAIFYALALHSVSDPQDMTYANQRKAGQILESIFPDNPNHPGIAHYIIHAYDNPVLASKALSTARNYAKIAPASAHAQHMPSHIFTRLGLWDESISSNLNSTESAVCYAEQAGFDAHWDEELHSLDYLVYAYLQKGDNSKANDLNDYLNSIENVYPVNFKDAYALAAIPARIVMENKNWGQAANLQLSSIDFPWEDYPWQKSILHFTRAMGASHIGDLDKAKEETAIIDSLHQSLVKTDNQYQAIQVLIQLKTSQAWLALAEGKDNDAITLMEEAADMEDKTTKHPVTPCEVIPARELLGDMYYVLNRPAESFAAYQLDLQSHPYRFNGIYGAALAAKTSGNKAAATRYFNELTELSNFDSDRMEIKEANSYLSAL